MRIPSAKCRISNVGSRWYITAVITVLQRSYTFQQPLIVCCTRPLMVLNLLSYQRHGASPRHARNGRRTSVRLLSSQLWNTITSAVGTNMSAVVERQGSCPGCIDHSGGVSLNSKINYLMCRDWSGYYQV